MVEAKGEIRILENTLYFPGWTVSVDGKPVTIEFQDQDHRGIITFHVDSGKHLVNIVYKDTKIRKFSDVVSLVSLAVLGLFIFRSKIKKSYNKKNGKL